MGRILIKDAPLSMNQKEHFPFCFSTDNSVESPAPFRAADPCWEGAEHGAAAWRPGLPSISSSRRSGRAAQPRARCPRLSWAVPPAPQITTYRTPCTNRDAQVNNTTAQTYGPSDPIFTPVSSQRNKSLLKSFI